MSGLHLRHWPGDPDRPALALHCMMGTASGWAAIARHLHGAVDLRAFDMPGHGRSPDWQDDGVDFHTTVTRLAASLITRPVDLIGHSIGATVALRIAVAAPEAIRSLTLIEPVLFAAAPDPAQKALDATISEFLDQNRTIDAARTFIDTWGQEPFDTLAPHIQVQMGRQIRMVASSNDVLNHDTARILRDGGLEAIDAPVLFIAGEASPPVVHTIIDALAARMADVGRARIPGAGHMVPLTHPRQVAELIALNLERA